VEISTVVPQPGDQLPVSAAWRPCRPWSG